MIQRTVEPSRVSTTARSAATFDRSYGPVGVSGSSSR